jgi:hypothetical protein
VPAVASLLERARQEGVAIAYGTRAANMLTSLPEVAPSPGDIKIESHAGEPLTIRETLQREISLGEDRHSVPPCHTQSQRLIPPRRGGPIHRSP